MRENQPSIWSRFYATAVFYPTLFWNILLGRWLGIRNWWDRIDDHVVLGARPFASDVKRMSEEEGVKAVVNTCEEYEGPKSEYAKYGIEQFWMPTTDFTHPSFDDVCKAVEFVEENAQANKTVYIHCKAGRARSATVAICWLMKYRGMSGQRAQEHLLKCRPHVNAKLTSRPVVQRFADQIKRG